MPHNPCFPMIPHRARLSTIAHTGITTLMLCVFFVVCFVSPLAFAAKASVWANPSIITPNEPFTLTITLEGSDEGAPDLAVLEKDFQLLKRSNSNSIKIINGTTTIKKSWSLVLLPLGTGKIKIPAIKIGNEFTNPITIEVTDTPPTEANKDTEAFIEVDAIPLEPYVSGQILFTQKLFYTVPIENASMGAPVVKDDAADVVQLANRAPYNREIKGRRYSVIERSYALFPKHSGKLQIGSSIFRAIVPSSTSQGQFGMFDLFANGRNIQAYSKPLSLEVKPKPATFSGGEWLPAKNITLYGNWSKSVDQIKAGEPVTLQLGVIADGLRAEQLPDLQIKIPDSVKSYPDKPELNNNTTNSGVTGVWNQKLTLIPSAGGNFTIPDIKLPWWNVTTDEQEIATLPGVTLKVSGAPAAAKKQPEEDIRRQPHEDIKSSAGQIQPENGWTANVAWMMALLFALFLALFFGYRFLQRRKSTSVAKSSSTHVSIKKNGSVEGERKTVMLRLKKACLENNPQQGKSHLIEWAAQIAEIQPATLESIAQVDDGYFREQIALLSKALYSRDKNRWHGDKLWELVAHYQRSNGNQQQTLQSNDLLELYPRRLSENSEPTTEKLNLARFSPNFR